MPPEGATAYENKVVSVKVEQHRGKRHAASAALSDRQLADSRFVRNDAGFGEVEHVILREDGYKHNPAGVFLILDMPSTVLLTLPPELLLKVIHLLPTSDVQHLQLTCKHLRSIVEFSGFHTYAKQLHLSGVHDDFPPGFSYFERLKALKQRDENWASLRPRSIARMNIPFHASGIYDLTGGVFLLGYKGDTPSSTSTRGFHYTMLPTIDSDSGSHSQAWPGVEFESEVIDVGLAIPEHDLIAVVTW